MSKDPSKTLEILFAFDSEVITRDLRRAEDDIRDVADEISSLLAISFEARTPEIETRRSHLLMIQAHELCRQDTIAPEVQTFYAASGAVLIVQDAEEIAANRDTCADISAQMEAIRRREGLPDGEDWMLDEGPQDFRELSDKFGRILERIEDTVFVFVLRRYHLKDQADLFERDRVDFEIQREIGRRVVRQPKTDIADDEKTTDDYFWHEYGPAALDHIKARVREIRRNGEHLSDGSHSAAD